ncbi:MAG: chromosome segregation protein SMC [Clostridia bacterium]|nr:chromosome segregation protein SMC [Clostridia bacterium]
MYLKKLSLFGFKSFAGRVELDLTRGIVGIVGPNGVGKSNISDALRWALGEQSARLLRGSKMQDVIFAGSESRRGLGYAEVTLVFDNSDQFFDMDFDEVTVTRKLYRSGEGEYSLNGVACRLRDISDLFSGTGLGREAYSVVEQGKIDSILSARPEDRRAVFDEASGTAKYRVRKREAERKLAEVHADQLRVGDLAAELARQLPLLEAQAEQARLWQDLTDRASRMELDILSADILQLASRRAELAARLESLIEEERADAVAVAECEAALEDARMSVAQAESAVDAMHSAASEAAATAERESGRVQVCEERRAALEAQSAQIEAMLSAESDRLTVRRSEFADVSARAAEARCSLEQCVHEAKQLEARAAELAAQVAAAESAAEGSRASLFGALARGAELRSRSAANEASRRSGQARVERIRAQIASRSKEQERAEEASEQAAIEAVSLERAWAEAGNGLDLAKADLATSRLRLEQSAGRFGAASSVESEIRATHTSLEAIQRQYEGYGRAVRTLLSKDGGKRLGLLGVVADLIRVPREYETAVEAALGAAVQNIVASSSDAAERAVGILKSGKSGRATFLPLDILRPSPLPRSEVPHGPGIVGLASELVECAPEHRKAVDYLLGRVVVVAELARGVALAKTGLRCRIVTLDGDAISSGGAITGGEIPDRQAGLLARSRRLEEIQADLARAEAERSRLGQDRESAASAVEASEEALGAAQRRRAECELALRTLTERARNQSSAHVRSSEELEALRLELESVLAENESLEADAVRISDEAVEAELARAEIGQAQAAAAENLASLRADAAAASRCCTEAASALAASRERTKALDAALERAKADCAASAAELARLGQDTERVVAESASNMREIEAAREAAAVCAQSHRRMQEDLDSAREAKASRAEAANAAERNARAARRAHGAVSDLLAQVRVEDARVEAEYESAVGKLAASYCMSPEEALRRDVVLESRESVLSEIAVVRAKISEMGPVNHAAVEEHSGLAQRCAFLQGQLADLDEAQESLARVAGESERVCKKQFMETFEAIRIEFNDIFDDIFGGGTADLILDDTDNPLECGIDVACQPPGKKLTNLSLLSGGERALVAIALLFAIMRVKPSPVCVLDEIDSALDEANVARFVDLLGPFSRQVQILLVTHRKRTMECADTLFGVTMEESGVSKVFSIRAAQ